MKVGFDTTALSLFINPNARGPTPDSAARVVHLIDTLTKRRVTILVPTPVLGELLVPVASEAVPEYMKRLSTPPFRLAPFDGRAAVVWADLQTRLRATGDKRGGVKGDWQRIKVDQQIVALLIAEGVEEIYTADSDLKAFAGDRCRVVSVQECPLPPVDPQMDMFKG